MIAGVGVPGHNDIAALCYRVLARFIFGAAGDNPIANHVTAGSNRRFWVRLATADPPRSGRCKHGEKDTSDEDKQSKQDAQIQKC